MMSEANIQVVPVAGTGDIWAPVADWVVDGVPVTLEVGLTCKGLAAACTARLGHGLWNLRAIGRIRCQRALWEFWRKGATTVGRSVSVKKTHPPVALHGSDALCGAPIDLSSTSSPCISTAAEEAGKGGCIETDGSSKG